MKIQGAVIIVIVAVIVAIISGSIVYVVKPTGVTTTTTITAPPTTTTTPPPEVNALTIFHWWTSGGEKAAIDALVNVFKEQYPDVAIMQSPVTGGAGYTMLPVIKSLVLAGQAPDAFQMHAGYEGKPYFDADLLDPIDDIWTSEGLTAVIPDVVQSMCKFDGHFYAVPVNIHRVNVVWYNKSLLDANGINPATLTTWDAFFDACDKLKAAGVQYPIVMGETWTAAHAFEQIVASVGIDFYEDWINGKVTSASDPRLVQALNTFRTYMGYVNPDHAALTWDDATARVINGTSAFNIMGDWANGEFLVAGKTYGVDYGTFAVPGTQDMYGLCIDCFQHPAGVAHPTNSDRWLKVVGSKAGQDAFNPLKGSIAARTDADLTKYGPYQQSAIADFKTVTYMFPSVVHGSGAPEAFKVKLSDIMSAFVTNLDVTAAASAMTSYTAEIINEYTVVWSLD
jgi:glucose/mannose transport system substrate-binding protein